MLFTNPGVAPEPDKRREDNILKLYYLLFDLFKLILEHTSLHIILLPYNFPRIKE